MNGATAWESVQLVLKLRKTQAWRLTVGKPMARWQVQAWECTFIKFTENIPKQNSLARLFYMQREGRQVEAVSEYTETEIHNSKVI